MATPLKRLAEPAEDSPLVNARQVGAILGLKQRSVRDWASDGRLPKPRRLGRRLVWVRSEIVDFALRLPEALV